MALKYPNLKNYVIALEISTKHKQISSIGFVHKENVELYADNWFDMELRKAKLDQIDKVFEELAGELQQ